MQPQILPVSPEGMGAEAGGSCPGGFQAWTLTHFHLLSGWEGLSSMCRERRKLPGEEVVLGSSRGLIVGW